MNFHHIIFFIIVLISPFVTAQKTDAEVFAEFSKKFRVPRSTVAYNNVIRNYRSIHSHNSRFEEGLETFNQSLNQFSHLSLEEISKFKLGALENDPNEVRDLVNETDLIGRRGRAIVPPAGGFLWPESITGKVKYQGNCGSCYAFAAVNVIKSKLALTYGVTNFDLSEQDALECSRGCAGGWDYVVYRDYSQRYNGVAAYNYGSYHTYTATSNGCKASYRPRVPNTRVKGYYYLARDENTIMTALVNKGPLYTRFDVYENFYQYSGGIYNYASGRNLGGHAIMLVGYGEENGNKYWILKNSWDTWWGENGYFRMARGKNLCGIEGSVSYVEL